MILISSILTFLGFIDYLIFYLSITKGWKNITEIKFEANNENTSISLIIAARNEEKNISYLLKDILKQQIKASKLELILINDHSEDKTSHVALSSYPNIKIIQLSDGENGKKAALTKGILNAKGSIIVTIDSDCRVGPNWLEEITKPFKDPKIKLVCGPVLIKNSNSMVSLFQYFEFNGLVSIGAGLHGIKKPSLANGANFAFLRKVWIEIGGYSSHSNIGSGDDELFLMEVENKYPNSVTFNPNQEAIVYTQAQGTWKALLNQRIRWASKHKYYKNKNLKFMLIRFFLFHLWLLLLFVGSIINPWLFIILLIGWLGKDVSENVLLKKSFTKWKLDFPIWKKMLLQPSQWIMVVIIGISANVKKTYTWKGRKQR